MATPRRRSRSSAAISSALETASSAATTTARAAASTLLHSWDDLPAWRRDNAFLLTGYRPASNSYLGSFRSLGRLHNESVNIWSHLLGALFFAAAALSLHRLVVVPRYGSASPADLLVLGAFFAGALACLGMSATYHALSNHSARVAKWGNKLDYSGIVCLIVGSYVPALYYGLFCHPALMSVYLYLICLLGSGCLVVSWFEHFRTPAWRPYRALMFVGLGVSGVVPVLHSLLSLYSYGQMEERMGLSWVLFEGFLYIAGAFLYAFRWPERQYPRTFDIWGSSHQIFHIFVLLAAASHLQGMAKAFDYHHSVMGATCVDS